MKVLILGGTGFLGPHFVRAARARGHELTLFNRGKTNPHLFPELEKLRGERDGGLDSIAAAIDSGRRWDAVVDTSGYVPRIVRDSAQLLSKAADHYLFVSSISVYADTSEIGLTEAAPVGVLDDPTIEEISGESYGPLKALCEQEAEKAFPGRASRVRPGLIVGPGDPTDRFTYWPVRAARGGRMIAPGSPGDPIQFIDARDLSDWMVGCLENGHHGTYNLTSPAGLYSIGKLIDACQIAIEGDVQPVWIPADFLEEHEVQPWQHMTVWVPPTGEYAGFGMVSVERAVASGLRTRKLESVLKETLQWWKEQPEERRAEPKAGLAAKREAEVLAAWDAAGVQAAAG
jgi:2'-hydroxyisoflavone reductase